MKTIAFPAFVVALFITGCSNSFSNPFSNPFSNRAVCYPTERDLLGPYYLANSPVTNHLARAGTVGTPMTLQGMVQSAAPPFERLEKVKVEIWHADASGAYHPQNNGDYNAYRAAETDLRGTVYTEKDGSFKALSIVPGKYGGRPVHVHYKISAEGYKTLITQHYLNSNEGGQCRLAQLDRSQSPALLETPTIYLQPQ